MKKILGLGNALTDILLQVSEDDLRELGFPKGSMNLISKDQAEQIQYRFLSVRKRMVAGGSASNAINCIASLGGKAAFIDCRIHKGLSGALPPLKFSHREAIDALIEELNQSTETINQERKETI